MEDSKLNRQVPGNELADAVSQVMATSWDVGNESNHIHRDYFDANYQCAGWRQNTAARLSFGLYILLRVNRLETARRPFHRTASL